MESPPTGRERGFSLIELMLTIALAGIIFAAMVPFFYNALRQTSRDARRNDAQLIAQDRIEQVRLLNYADISQTNLTSGKDADGNNLGDGKFGTTYTPVGQRPYSTAYAVTHIIPTGTDVSDTDYEKVVVTVTTPDGLSHVDMSTIIKNPAPGIVSTDSGGSSGTLPTTNLSITCSFKNWSEVVQSTSKGVYYKRTATDGTTFTSTHLYPTSASSPTVQWTGLTGGTTYTYVVYCYSSQWDSGNTPFQSPPFHLLKSARLKFDTNPGGS